MVTKKSSSALVDTPKSSPRIRTQRSREEVGAGSPEASPRPSKNYFSCSFLVLLTIFVMIFLEAFFRVPSSILHGDWSFFRLSQPTIIVDDILSRHETHFSLQNEKERICPAVYEPVCGSDKKTYENRCELTKARVSVRYTGECRTENPSIITPSASQSGTVPNNSTASGNVTLSGVSHSTENVSTGSQNIALSDYKVTTANYTFSLPKYAYYRADQRTDGNSYLAIDTADSHVSDFASAEIQAIYSPKGTLPHSMQRTLQLERGVIGVNVRNASDERMSQIVEVLLRTVKTY